MNCLLCQSDRSTLTRQISVAQLRDAWQRTLGIDVADEFDGVDEISQWQCESCGLGWYSPLTLAGSAALYEQLQRHPWYYPEGKWEHRLSLLDLKKQDTLLEVGSGRGEFLAMMNGATVLRAEGLEINRRAADEARQNGLMVRVQDVSEAAQQTPGRYDAVCAFQVLEHVPNPRPFLEACCALLRPGGRLILGLPNADSFLKHQFNLLDMPPHHMTRWTQRVLQRLCDLLPLRMDHVRREPLAAYHAEGYVGVYCRMIAEHTHWRLRQPAVVRGLAALMRTTGLRRLLTGQSIYACFSRA